MANVTKQKTCVKYCSCNEIFSSTYKKHLKCCKKLLKMTISKTTVFDSYTLKDDRESAIDDAWSGRTSTSINNQDIDNRESVLGDWCLIIRDIIEQVLI